MKRTFRTFLNCLNPNATLPMESRVWPIVALLFIVFALVVACVAPWQTEGFVRAEYKDGRLIGMIEVVKACRFSVVPHLAAVFFAFLICFAIGFRCSLEIRNLWTLFFLFFDWWFVASLIESFLPAQSVCLFEVLGLKVLSVSPMMLVIIAILMSWLGIRALSGASIILFMFAFWARVHELDVAMGFWGVAYFGCGVMSLVLQCKLPCMIPHGGLWSVFLQDFCGKAVGEIRQSIQAAGDSASRVAVDVKTMAAESSAMLFKCEPKTQHDDVGE